MPAAHKALLAERRFSIAHDVVQVGLHTTVDARQDPSIHAVPFHRVGERVPGS